VVQGIQLQEDDERQRLVAVGLGQWEAGDPEQLVDIPLVVGRSLVLGAGAGRETHRLARHRAALRDSRQRPAADGERPTAEIGEAGRGPPRVDVHREPHVARELDRGDVRVDDGVVVLIDDEDRHRHVGQDGGQRRVRAGVVPVTGDGGVRGSDDARLLTELRVGVDESRRGAARDREIGDRLQRTRGCGRNVVTIALGRHEPCLTVHHRSTRAVPHV
jgi:hypothetical protein